MLCAIAVLVRLSRDWTGLAIAAAFATTPVIFRYAVLPDVFALHCALSAGLIALAFERPSSRRIWFATVLFGLGAANHQSIIFLAPLLGFIVFEERRLVDRFGALILGAALSVLAYLSLLLMDNGHVYSWRELQTTGDVIAHFLRSDYGTFQLSGAQNATFGGSCALFVEIVGAFGSVALLCAALGLPRIVRSMGERASRAWVVLAACLVLYVIVMFPRLGVGDASLTSSVLERFFILPALLLATLAVTGAREVMRSTRPLIGCGLSGVVTLLVVFQVALADTPALRRDAVIEEYARNLLTSAKHPSKGSLLVVYSDSQIFPLRYVQATEAGFEKIVVMPRGLMLHPGTFAKAKMFLPGLFDPLEQRRFEHHDLFDDFLLPNAQRYNVVHVLPYTSPTMHTTFLPLGRRIQPGTGTDVDLAAPRFEPQAPVYRKDEPGFVETKSFYAAYAIYDLARAKELALTGDLESAKKAARDALERVPYCIPCMKNICALTDDPAAKVDCDAKARDFEAREFDYLQ
ncbi:MAG: hypothetical protein H7Z43_09835 [Clostridia bacterium]|nr:hypothetical protein [Deltaproteobacteria bacterium]